MGLESAHQSQPADWCGRRQPCPAPPMILPQSAPTTSTPWPTPPSRPGSPDQAALLPHATPPQSCGLSSSYTTSKTRLTEDRKGSLVQHPSEMLRSYCGLAGTTDGRRVGGSCPDPNTAGSLSGANSQLKTPNRSQLPAGHRTTNSRRADDVDTVIGARLCPSGIATGTPQTFLVASRATANNSS
jgi:hypothetical protein